MPWIFSLILLVVEALKYVPFLKPQQYQIGSVTQKSICCTNNHIFLKVQMLHYMLYQNHQNILFKTSCWKPLTLNRCLEINRDTCIGMYNDYNAMLAILNTHKILARDKFGSFLGLMSTKLNGSPECHLGCFQHFCFVFWAPIVDNLLILDSLESLLSALQLEHEILIYHTC